MCARRTVVFCALALLLSFSAHQGYAQDIRAYIYDDKGYAIPSPRPYMHREFVNISFLEPRALRQPEDFLVDRAGNIFIADTGNERILKMSPDMNLLLEIVHEEMPRPTGLFLHEESGDILVADAGENHLLRFDAYGNLIRTYPKPTSAVLPEDFMYSPGRVLVDKRGMIYVIGTGAS
ncbi:MAG: hypothetical protein KAU31_03975, partial [Spirochaetaceae bacterium]|nr:hypothetical protein [Spirochaetaceae bacterium]